MNVIRPLHGTGYVAHEGGFMLVCGEGDLVDELLALLHDIASSGGDGRALARRGNRVLAGAADSFDCAMAGPVEGGIAVLVSGTATASVTGSQGDVLLDGRNAITTQDLIVPGPITRLELKLSSAGKADPHWRLDAGVVPGGGLEGADLDMDAPPRPSRPAAEERPPYAEPEPTQASVEATPDGDDAYFEQQPMDGPEPPPGAPFPPSFPPAPPGFGPPPGQDGPPPGQEFPADPGYGPPPGQEFPAEPGYGPAGQEFAPPGPGFGPPPQDYPPGPGFGPPPQDYPPAPDQFAPPPPPGGPPAPGTPGILVLDDGLTLQLDSDYLVGRDPERAAEVQSGDARPIRLTDAEGSVSRRHARVMVEGGEVRLMDLGSVNGTHIQTPGQAGYYPIDPNEPVTITPGTQVLIGGTRTFRYDPAGS